MELKKCEICGGTVVREGNFYVCEYCGNRWEIDSANDIHAVDRANAWSALRDGDFEKAAEQFENIIVKEPDNHEAYWGRALALSGIVYVTDLSENKKVPTCNNITEESIHNSKDVQKAISLAPTDIAEGYRQQAEYIDRVRIEWLEKASKEPEYDVFISFKDSDRENGIERTQDSIDAQDLYNALVAEGYKVFFSRISLRDKISEQYEPYIYNAIKTSKVMIVFGEKPEYFSSVWIKNEWYRFKARIEKGEKHKNSLVVVYKNMSPGDLPIVLRARQCLNAADMTFLSDLTKHIRRVVDESKKNKGLERIEIKGGQISKKASTLSVNTVETHEIGLGSITETSISEKQSISLIYTYLKESQWKQASSLAGDILFNNPACAEAVWCSLLIKHRVQNDEGIKEKISSFKDNDYAQIDKLLNCASKDFAYGILKILYESESMVTDKAYCQLLKTILPFRIDNRQQFINTAFNSTIKSSKINSFEELLKTIDSQDVDTYIDYNYQYAITTDNISQSLKCLESIIGVDIGNVKALRELTIIQLKSNSDKIALYYLGKLLSYSDDIKREGRDILCWLYSNLETTEQCAFSKELLRYYPSELSELNSELLRLSHRLLSKGFFEDSIYFSNLVLSFDPNAAEAYWYICLGKIQADSEEKIPERDALINDLPEFNKYLSLVEEYRRKECILISKKQIEAKEVKQQNKNFKLISDLIVRGVDTAYPIVAAVSENGNVYLSNQDKFKRVVPEKWLDMIKLSIGCFHGLGLDKNGRVFSSGDNQYGQLNVSEWRDIIDIAAGGWHSVGLKPNGSVVAVGSNEYGQCNVSSWNNIIKIAAGRNHTVGLKSDGTIIATGLKSDSRCNTSGWNNVVDIIAFNGTTVGLTSDGGILCVGQKYDVSSWSDIIDVALGYQTIVGLKADGTVLYSDENGNNSVNKSETKEWNNIAAVSILNNHIVGLKTDGTVVACGLNKNKQCETSDWRNIVAVVAIDYGTVGVNKSGNLTLIGNDDGLVHSSYALSNWRLFTNYDCFINGRQKALNAFREHVTLMAQRSSHGLCPYCGGDFKKSLFKFKCINCGKVKDY